MPNGTRAKLPHVLQGLKQLQLTTLLPGACPVIVLITESKTSSCMYPAVLSPGHAQRDQHHSCAPVTSGMANGQIGQMPGAMPDARPGPAQTSQAVRVCLPAST